MNVFFIHQNFLGPSRYLVARLAYQTMIRLHRYRPHKRGQCPEHPNALQSIHGETDNMAFVNEIIPEDEKSKFTFPISTRRDGSKPTLWKWTVDRDRDAFLIHTKTEGGSYEGTPEDKHYLMIWNGLFIRFVGTSTISGSLKDGYVISWLIREISIPNGLKSYEQDVLALIREALDVMGWLYNRSRITAVNVQFDIPTGS